MKINSREFCNLSGDARFQKWLYRIKHDLYRVLMDHLHKGEGCSSNKAKMVEILKVMLADRILSQQLKDFLRSAYPHIISDGGPPKVAVNYVTHNKHNVFQHYDPTLATFPRRLIITVVDARQSNKSLDAMVRQFCQMQAISEHIIIDDYAYIEYLPMEYTDIKDQVPEKNWQIRLYRTRNI
jgi:hypothetical protein